MDFPFLNQYRIQKRAMPHHTRYRPYGQIAAIFFRKEFGYSRISGNHCHFAPVSTIRRTFAFSRASRNTTSPTNAIRLALFPPSAS